ncbi:unnamed protein product [Prunus armeniaca]
MNFDGSIINSQATTGFVLLVDANNIGENSINVAESVALWDGLAVAIDRGWGQIVIEGKIQCGRDCQARLWVLVTS